jgi:hypothetical protein
MKKWLFVFLLSFLFCSAVDHAVTYEHSGRLGDNLLCYLRAKWISYQYGIPLLYKPFGYSKYLKLDDLEIHFNDDFKKTKRSIVKLKKEKRLGLSQQKSTLYVCPYFPEDKWELEHGRFFSFQVNWKDLQFRKLAREMICPKNNLLLIEPQKNTINIALHIREGGGCDDDHTKRVLPLKLPPMSFYIDGLNTVLPQLANQKIYCRLFTDAKEPEKIVKVLQAAILQHYDITFDYREENSHNSNVLEDFFSLFNFDILIRPQSNFSIVPSLLHDFAILYFPTDVGEAELQINSEVLNEVLKRVDSIALF